MIKDPQSKLDFAFDWSAWLAAEGDTAASFAWTVPDGLTPSGETSDGGKATIWLAGGTAGQDYRIVCRITTTAGRVDERTTRISVRNR